MVGGTFLQSTTKEGWTAERLATARATMAETAGDVRETAAWLGVSPATLDLALHDLLGRTPEQALTRMLAREAGR